MDVAVARRPRDKQAILSGWHDPGSRPVRQGRAGELEPNEVVQPENTVQREVPRHHGAPVLPPRRRRRQARRGAGARAAAAADGRRGRAGSPRAGRGARLHALRPRGAGRDAAGRDVRRQHGASARSTGCRRCSTRTRTRRSRTSTTSRRGASRCCSTSRAATPGGRWRCRRSPWRRSPTRASLALPPDAPSIALYSMSPTFVRGIESSGWLRWLLDHWGLDYRERDRGATSRRARSPTPTCCSCPTATRRAIRPSRATRTGSRTSGLTGQRRSGRGCRAAAATSAGSTAPCSPRAAGVSLGDLRRRRGRSASPRPAR